MLMKNFQRHYNTNRAPFGLSYHPAWSVLSISSQIPHVSRVQIRKGTFGVNGVVKTQAIPLTVFKTNSFAKTLMIEKVQANADRHELKYVLKLKPAGWLVGWLRK